MNRPVNNYTQICKHKVCKRGITDLVFRVILDIETIFYRIPENLGMLLAHCVLVGKVEVVRIIYSFLSSNVYC